MDQFSSAREFRIWDYYVSFSQLLLRSVADANTDEQTTIDIIFRGVFYLDLPATLAGIETDSATEQEIAHLVNRTGIRPDPAGQYHTYFVLISEARRYYVGAMDMVVTRNKLGPMETSLGIAYHVPQSGSVTLGGKER